MSAYGYLFRLDIERRKAAQNRRKQPPKEIGSQNIEPITEIDTNIITQKHKSFSNVGK